MVVCVNCGGQERLVTRSLATKEVFPKPPDNDDMRSDPTVITLMFRCNNCKNTYSFERVVTTDELRNLNKKAGGCGGCGP